MSDRDRVLSLLEAGKITGEEATTLLSALGEIEETETELTTLRAELEGAPVADALNESAPPASPAEPPEPARPPEPVKPEEAEVYTPDPPTSFVPADLNWIRIDLMAGDIDIRVDTSLTEPAVKGKAVVEKKGDDFVIRPRGNPKGNRSTIRNDIIEKLMGSFGDIDVRIPPGYGVDIRSKAGDVDVRDVPFLKVTYWRATLTRVTSAVSTSVCEPVTST